MAEAAAPTPVQRRAGRRRPSLRLYLVLLVLAATLPFAAFATYALWRKADADRQQLEHLARERAQAIAAALDGDLERYIGTLQALATSPSLRSGDLAGFQQQALRSALAPSGWYVLMDPDGQQRVNTLRPFGAPLPRTPVVPEVAVSGRPIVSNMFAGPVAQRQIVVVGVAVIQDDRVAYILGAGIPAAELRQVLLDQHLPVDWPTSIVDRAGTIVARTHEPERWVGQPASPDLRTVSGGRGGFRTITVDGIPVYTAIARSTASSWTVAIGVPLAAIDGPPLRSALDLLSIGGALVLLGSAAALLLGRRITQPMRQLTAAATALGRGETPEPPRSGFYEVDAAGSALVEAGAARRKLEQQLVHSQRLEAIGTLTGGMAHDFNNLLGIIIGNLDMMRDRETDHQQRELTDEAMGAALRGAELTRSLLAFARRQPLRPVRIAVNDLAAETVRLLRRTLGESIEISLALAGDLWPVVADPAQLETSLTNLATNARDAMPKGGRLVITTANVQLDADYAASHPEVIAGDYVAIEVTDGGEGIPADILGRIFEPFFTTKEQGKGSGLGLSMVFGFIKQSGGHVAVYSEPGAGTTFRLYLPRVAASVASVVDAPAAVFGGSETVLVVEDNAAMRRVVIRQLSELGYRALEAEAVAAALDILENEKIDLLFTDVVMPGGANGFDLARSARARWPALKIVLTSGFPAAVWSATMPASRACCCSASPTARTSWRGCCARRWAAASRPAEPPA